MSDQRDISREGVGVNADRCAPTPNCLIRGGPRLGYGWGELDKNMEDAIDQRDRVRKGAGVKDDRCAVTPNCLLREGKILGEGGCAGAGKQGLKRRIEFWEQEKDRDDDKDIRKEWGHHDTTMARITSSKLEQLGRFD